MPYDDPIYSSPVVGVASDADYVVEGDAYDGLPTKVTPSAGELAQGARPDHQLAAEQYNWILNQQGQFLDALHADGQSVDDQLSAVTAALVVFTSTSVTSWTAGPNDHRVELDGWGAGSGGGGGSPGDSFTTIRSVGGGGGAGALRNRIVVDVVPGTTYEVICGLGGDGGTAPPLGTPTDGSPGGDTIFRVAGGATLATFKGAATGGRAGAGSSTSTDYVLSPGGTPTDQFQASSCVAATYTPTKTTTFCFGPGFGGEGANKQLVSAFTARRGAGSREGYAGGAAGAFGADGGGYPGGGAGGGGAAGPGGPGMPGKPGGDGNSSGPGSDAPMFGVGGYGPGSGCGGGGGGGGGSGSTAGGVGSAGLAGDSGKLTLRVIG